MKIVSCINSASYLLAVLVCLCLWRPVQADTARIAVNDVPARGTLTVCKVATTDEIFPCSIGKNGIRIDKKEGDGATPIGSFPIRTILYRADKLSSREIKQLKKLRSKGFTVQALTPEAIWVDDIESPDYNKLVPISTLTDKNISHEKLWREDDVYDIIVVIGYNDKPVVKGKGSAIFMHVMRVLPSGEYGPTTGCVAFLKADLLKVLTAITPKTWINIAESGEIVLN